MLKRAKTLLTISVLVTAPIMAGAWGAGSFENDSALDWTDTLVDRGSLESVYKTLRHVLSAKYVDVDLGASGLAAAEVVAALDGRPASSLPEGLRSWIASQDSRPTAEQLKLAGDAIEVVWHGAHSELRELWGEAEPKPWDAKISALSKRLLRKDVPSN